ncbi:recombinase family protein [Streptomyces noursei]|uniref:recombinase family protein n=1 Tax=Streptomyces noursei TaxID=1971 RepID=UPI00344BBE4F
MNEKPQVAVYTRVAKAGNPVAQDLQHFQCWDWAESRGMEITQVYHSTGENDLFLDLLNDVSAGGYDAVVATEHSRYNRRAERLRALTDLARQHGIQVYTVAADDLDLASPAGTLTLEMLSGSEAAEEQAIARRQVERSWKDRS